MNKLTREEALIRWKSATATKKQYLVECSEKIVRDNPKS